MLASQGMALVIPYLARPLTDTPPLGRTSGAWAAAGRAQRKFDFRSRHPGLAPPHAVGQLDRRPGDEGA